MPKTVRVPPGETLTKSYDVLDTIACTIEKPNRMTCHIIRTDEEFRNVFSIHGDIGVVADGENKVWIKPKPPTNCMLVVYERKEREEPGGKDIKVACGIKLE